MTDAMKRFRMMIELHKNSTHYISDMGFDYEGELSNAQSIEDYAFSLQAYLDTEKEVSSKITEVAKKDNGEYVITIEADDNVFQKVFQVEASG